MRSKLTTLIVLAAITLQGVFGGLQGSVVICLGGGHEHAPTEVVEHCDLECSHHAEWPTPVSDDQHTDDCGCTDFELGLIVLLTTPRVGDRDLELPAAVLAVVPEVVAEWSTPPTCPPPRVGLTDPGGLQQRAVLRGTRLQV